MIRTREQAATFAEQAAAERRSYATRRCLEVVRTWYAIPALFQDGADHDGLNEAIDAWAGATRKHPNDRDLPRGVPVFFAGGPSGHVAISTGCGAELVSSDWPLGHIGLTTIDAIERAWTRRFLGWTEDLNGVVIPTTTPASHPSGAIPAAPTITLPEDLMAKLDPDDVKAIVDAVVTRLPEAVWAFRSASNGDQVDMRQYLVNAQPIGVWGYRNPADAVDMHQMLVDVHDAAQ